MADDSDTSLVIEGAPPLPPIKEPRGKILYEMDDEWGHATVYNPVAKSQPQLATTPVKTRSTKRSIMSKSAVEGVKQEMEGSQTASTKTDGGDIFWCLPFFQSSMMATILEDTVTELRILHNCNSEMKVTKTLMDMKVHLALKYGVKQLENVDELEGINPANLGCLIYKLNKLESDRLKILKLFTTLYVELSTEKCFETLLDAINTVFEREEYALWLIEDEARNKILRKELSKQLRIQRNHQISVTYETDGIIANLKSQLEDQTLVSETKSRYVDNWQSARTEQHQLAIHEEESVFTNSTEYYKRRSDNETRVHGEVEMLTNIIISETLKKVEDMMDKYDRDMEKIDLRIQITRGEYQSKLEHRRDLEKLFTRHAKEIREWITFKDERAKANLYRDTMLKSAIIVQAWWRGLLVRKQLGPFRPKAKKKGK